jgi:hypothetical protein
MVLELNSNVHHQLMLVMEINFDLIFPLIIHKHIEDRLAIPKAFVDVHFEVIKKFDHQLNDEKVKQ